MVGDLIFLGEVTACGAGMIEIRCGWCNRAGRLSLALLVADVSVQHIMQAQIGSTRAAPRDGTLGLTRGTDQ